MGQRRRYQRKLRGETKKRGMSTEEKNAVRYLCLCFRRLAPEEQARILNLCAKVGQEEAAALFRVLTDRWKSVETIAQEEFCSKSVLYRLRREFYESYWQEKTGRPV